MKMLTCKDASHLISESQERPLGFWERWGLKMHLWMCVSCRRFERQMTLMRQALRMLGKRAEVDADSSGFPPEARERIRKALAERGGHED
ncbi:MAG: zf-HC2 domain-containing protein [Pseudomonadota bacterium]|nr:zf-HC2 domain-containing protein [Pseudomonadota bacterium]MDP1903785.1 zf-HC2 domain-containing protein [Pseudomonadota bacterium]MDP2353726.1 zf-HC2 domain-containing protein [Pseudomonadota bacterium]